MHIKRAVAESVQNSGIWEINMRDSKYKSEDSFLNQERQHQQGNAKELLHDCGIH